MKLSMLITMGTLALIPFETAFAAAVKAPSAFAACAACHAPAGGNGIGPSLRGVVGRKAGTLAGFHFSRAMRESRIRWNAKALNRYIANPQKVVPGNRMPYAGLNDAAQRAAVVQYLGTLR